MLAFLCTTYFGVIFKLKNNNAFLLSLVLIGTNLVCIAQNPSDVCASAVAITPSLTFTSTGYTLPGAYVYDGVNSACGSTKDDGWYSFTAQTSNYTFILGGDFNHAVAVYSGACGTLTPIACTNATAGNNATLQFTVTPNVTYFIQVQRNNGTTTSTMTGNFSFCYTSAPGGIKSNIKGWYKADGNIVKTGSNVTRWNTEVGTVNFTNVFNTPTLSAASVNFNPSVIFPGNAYLNNPSTLGSEIIAPSNNTVFLVTKVNAGGVLMKWDENQSTNRFDFETTPYPTSTALRFDHPSHFQTKTAGNMNQWSIATAATSNTTDNFIINGLVGTTGPGGTNNTSLTANFTIGGDALSGFHSNSEITEAVFYGGTLTATELRKVHSYLGVKYGITLGTNANALDYYSSNGTLIWGQTTSDQNDIAGLARDDASGLLQLKAKSSSTDDIITMALVDNAGTFITPNTFDNDNEFMLWGNDNGSQPSNVLGGGLIESTAECPSAILRRLARQWKVYETGSVGDVALTMDVSTIPISGTTFYDLRLLIDLDGDGDFRTGTVKRITPSAYVGGLVTFNNVDFNHGEIFTLATLVPSPGGVSSGLQIWLRASSLTSTQTNNAQLNTWYNVGSSNFDFSRIVGSNTGWPRFRTNTVNFNHSIEFGSLGAMISENSLVNMRPTTNSSTSMVVFKTTQNTSNTNFWSCPNFVTTESYYTGRDYGFGLNNGRLGIKINDGETWDANSISSCNDNVPHLAMAMRVRNTPVANASTVTLQLDGTTEISGAYGDSYPLDASAAILPSYRGTGIGGTSISGSDVYSFMQYTGQMSEVIVFNNNLSTVNLNKVNTYLAIKYGLTLGNTSAPITYSHSLGVAIWNASTTYQNDIAAIGRDDRSELDQRRSVSIEQDNMTDIALVDNGGSQAAPNAFNNDRSFFIIGNNDGAKVFSATDVDGATILNRLNRVWKVQETGTVGNVVVAVNLSAVPAAIIGADLRLLIDRDNDGFADNDITPQAADYYNAGTQTAYFTTDMANGDLFTIGTAANALPVEFISIQANAETDRNRITWITATELNNSRFVVQRRVQGEQWDSIGTVPGANTSNTIHHYEFFDANLSNQTFVYYRIVQYDYDGKSDASKIVYLDRTAFNNTSTLIKIGPNPSSGVIDININNELFSTNTYQLRVYSMLGTNVFDSDLKESNSRIDLENLAAGNYIIELLNSAGTAPVYEKIIIKHQ
ncbi:MAG: T9SS type A sorting domain-containing protein [Cytophagaceae bacterium]|nr:T9SS type A sorting domain-containing protein [Cytophagaceae bacterium]